MQINTEWVKQAGIRALKTFCQTALSMLTVGQALFDVDWRHVLSVSLVAAIISVLTSLAGLPCEDKYLIRRKPEELPEESTEEGGANE